MTCCDGHKLSFCVCWNSDFRVIVQVTGAENFRVRCVFFNLSDATITFSTVKCENAVKSVASAKHIYCELLVFSAAVLLCLILLPNVFVFCGIFSILCAYTNVCLSFKQEYKY